MYVFVQIDNSDGLIYCLENQRPHNYDTHNVRHLVHPE